MKVAVAVLLAMVLLGAQRVEAARPSTAVVLENVSFPGDAFHYGDTVRVRIVNQPTGNWNTVLSVSAPVSDWIVNGSPFPNFDTGYSDQGDDRDAEALFVLGTATDRNAGEGFCECNYSGEWTGEDAVIDIFVMAHRQRDRYAEVYGIPVLGRR